jgi:hypothetical protein
VCVHDVTYPYTEIALGSEANQGLLSLNEHITDLRNSVDQERFERRGLAKVWNGTPVNPGTLIDNSHLLSLKSAINTMRFLVFDDYSEGGTAFPLHIDNLRKAIENLRKECICNGNCGQHLVCACYNDCGCVYGG